MGREHEDLRRRRARLQAAWRVSDATRRKAIARRILAIDQALARDPSAGLQGASREAVAASGLQGVGGLYFDVPAPPGLGRLLRLPFYPTVANLLTVTSAGAGLASAVNPAFIEVPAGAATSGAHVLATPEIAWALLRVVGFETMIRYQATNAFDVGGAMVVSDLQVGGGPTLFTHDNFMDAEVYSVDQPEYVGLRDYPLVKTPTVVTVLVEMVPIAAGDTLTFSSALIAEVLWDERYGAHIPGPYARKGALVRSPRRHG